MNKKLSAILCLVLGIGVFIAAVSAATPNPILRSTEDSAIKFAEYTAPILNARVDSNGASVRHTSGQAHAQRPSKASTDNGASDAAQDSADDIAETSVVEGSFSTAAAREYNPVKYHNKAPNVKYVQQSCELCGTKH